LTENKIVLNRRLLVLGSALSLLSSPLCQHLLDGLLLLQKERPHDAGLGASGADGPAVGPGHGPFPLLQALVLARLDVLDPLQRHLAIAALGSLRRLVHPLRLEGSPRGPDGTVLVLGGVVRMAGRPRPTGVRHDQLYKSGLLLRVRVATKGRRKEDRRTTGRSDAEVETDVVFARNDRQARS
jgi:hypothetical protein